MLTIKTYLALGFVAMIEFSLIACNGSNSQNKPVNNTSQNATEITDTNHNAKTDAESDTADKMKNVMADSSLSQLQSVANLLNKNAGDSGQSTASNKSSAKEDTTAYYHPPLPDDFVIPVTGNGNDFYYQYYTGSVVKGQKNGVSFSLSATQRQTGKWNVLFKGFGKMNAMINISAHYSFLLNNTFTRLIINDDHKVYTEEKAKEKIDEPNYKVTGISVTKVGDEKLHGFNCVHAKITGTSTFMHQTSKVDMDIWRSMEPPGASVLESSIQTMVTPFTTEIENKLQQLNCKGAIVKVVITDPDSKVIKELNSIVKKDIPDAIFNIPSGYKEDKNTELYFLMN